MISFGYLWIAFINKLDEFLKNKCPPIYNLLFTSKYPIVRQLLSIPIGFLTGYAFYSYIVYRFDLEEKMERVIRYTVVSLITLMFTISIEMRAICTLVLPTFLGRSTRNFMIASLIISLINNPVMNTFDNSVILSKWFYCTATVGIDQGWTASQLAIEPAKQIMIRMSSSDKTFLFNDSEYDRVLGDFDETVYSKEKKEEKTTKTPLGLYRIFNRFRGGKTTTEPPKAEETPFSRYKKELKKFCTGDIETQMNQCYEHMVSPQLKSGILINIFDWTMRTAENIKEFPFCKNEKFRRLINRTCNINDNGTLSNNTSLMNSEKNLKHLSTKDMSIQHNISLPNITSILRYKQVLQEVQSYAEMAKSYSILSAKVARNLFLVVFLIIFFSSKSYHNKYLTDISFDNNYITNYFRRIDARRKKANKLSLLPLKRIEKLELIDPFGWKLTKIEKSHAKITTFLLFLLLIFMYLVQQIDVLLYDLIDLIRNEFVINVIQYGFNEMHPNVTGKDGYDGYMAKQMRKFLDVFNFETHVYKTSTFNVCKPNPSRTQDSVTNGFYTTFLVICLLNYIEMYSLRFRRVICSYFYRIRAKKRTLFLYNRTLKRRKGFLRYSVQRVKQLVNEKLFNYPSDQIHNTFAYGLINENNCGLLVRIIQKVFQLFIKSKCIICDEYLQKSQKHFKCADSKCNLNYCNQCWTECHERCLVCTPQLFADY